MEIRFDALLYSKLGNENSDAGHINCSRELHLARGPQVPHPCSPALDQWFSTWYRDPRGVGNHFWRVREKIFNIRSCITFALFEF